MLASIRARWGHRRTQAPAAADAISTAGEADAGSRTLPADSLVLLVPTEGGFSFYLHSFPDLGTARTAVSQIPPAVRQKVIVFRATHSQPQQNAASQRPAEAVVMTRDPGRPNVVQLSSFVDMESAQDFLQMESERGIDTRNALLFWASPVSIEDGAEAAPAPPQAVEATTRIERPVPQPAPQTARPAVPMYENRLPGAAATQPPIVAPSTAGVQAAKQAEAPRPEHLGLLSRLRAWPGWNSIDRRMVDAAMCRDSVYEETLEDPLAPDQAKVIIILAALAAAIGSFWAGPLTMLILALASPLGWVVHAYVAYWLATRFMRGRLATKSLRGLFAGFGFAGTPRIFFGLAVVPIYGPLLALLTLVWVGVATAVAAKRLLELDDASAMTVTMFSCLAMFAASIVGPSLLAGIIA